MAPCDIVLLGGSGDYAVAEGGPTFLDRLRKYPSYVEEIGGMPYEQFTRTHCHESPHTEDLLLRFARQVAGVG